MKRRGFTLTELLISLTLLSITTLVLVLVFGGAKNIFQNAEQEYVLGSEASLAMRWLRYELAYSNLATVRAYPNEQNPREAPGLSFLSADAPGDFGQFQISRHGTPRWQKHVFYTLKPDPQNAAISTLLRWEAPLSPTVGPPAASELLPSQMGGAARPRTVLHNLLSVGYGVTPQADVDSDPIQPGGFQVSFLRRQSTAVQSATVDSPENPVQTEDWERATELVEVVLYFANQNAQTGKWSTIRIDFHVFPQN